MNEFFAQKHVQSLLTLVLLMIIIALGAYAMLTFEQRDNVSQNHMPATISINGTGEVLAIPDIGQFSFSVVAEGDTAAAAQEGSGTTMNDILAFLREQGIEEKDIKTQNYNLYPRWRWEERSCPLGSFCPPGEQVEDGFEATQTVSVKIRNTDNSSSLISGVGERGATNISGLTFTIDDIDALRDEARAAALVDAQAKANELAKGLGVRIVRFVSFYENQSYYQEPYFAREMSMGGDMAASFMGPELPMGEETTKIEVNVTYEVR